MSVIKIKAVDQTLTITSAPMISAGDINTDYVIFSFDSSWNNYGKTAVFYRDDFPEDIYESAIDAQGKAVVPNKIMETDGKIWVGVIGVNGNDVITSEVVWYEIVEGIYSASLDSQSAEASAYSQMLTIAGQMQLLYNTLKNEYEQSLEEAKSELQTDISNEAATRAQADNVLSARMDEFTQLPSGSTSGDAELIDIRVGADGTTYANAGDAVRGQISDVKADLTSLSDDDLLAFKDVSWDNNGTITSGENAYQYNAARTTATTVYNKDIILHCDTGYRFFVVFYNSDDSFNYQTSLATTDVYVGANTKFRIVMRSNPDSAGNASIFKEHIHIRSEAYLNTLKINMANNKKQFIPVSFEPGTNSATGEILQSGKYIRCPVFEVEKDVIIKADTGYKFSCFFYDTNGTTLLYQSNMIDSGELLVSKGDKIKIIIGTTGNAYYVGNILDWLSHVYYNNERLSEIDTELSKDNKMLASHSLRMGSITDGAINHATNMVVTKDILHFDHDVLIHANDGYMFGLAYYQSDGTFISGEPSSKYDLIVPKNTYFRMVIRKVTLETTTKDPLAYAKNVTMSYFAIDDKPTHEWWNYLFGIAHAGADGYRPINTMISFKYAIGTLNQRLMEADLRFTSDNVPVLLHNSTIDATSDGTGEIASMTYEQVLQYDFGSYYDPPYPNTPIGTLEGLLKLCKDTGVYVCIEIKTDLTDAQLTIVKDLVDKYEMNDKLMFAASSIARYRRVWQYFDHPLYLWNLLYIPSGGVDDSIASVLKVKKNNNIICSLYKDELSKTTEIQKLLDAGIRIANASVISNADVLLLPEFVTMTSAHADMQDILRVGALAD